MATVIDTTQIIQGPANLYVGAFGATEPADGTWTALDSSIWVPAGATSGGLKLAAAMDYKSIEVDQVPDEVGVRMTGRKTTVETTMSEITLNNLKFLMNGGAITQGGTVAGGTWTIAASTGIFTSVSDHGLAVNDPVILGAITTTTGATAGVVYYVKTVPTTKTLTLSATRGGTALALTTDGSVASVSKGTWQAFVPLSSTAAFQPTFSALCVEGPAPYNPNLLRRVFVRKVLSTSGFDVEWKKETPQGLSAKFGAYYVSDTILPFRVLDQLS